MVSCLIILFFFISIWPTENNGAYSILHFIALTLRNCFYRTHNDDTSENYSDYRLSVHAASTVDHRFKDSFNCEMGMRGTVTCRVQIYSNNISNWTDCKILLQRNITQCCFNVRPTSATLANIKLLVSVPCLPYQYAGGQLFLHTHGNITVFVLRQSPYERNGELFTYRCRSST